MKAPLGKLPIVTSWVSGYNQGHVTVLSGSRVEGMTLRTLYQALLDCDGARLRVIAQQWDVALKAEARPDAAAQLADAMAHAEGVERVWEGLPPAARAALEDLLRRGGALPWAIFTRRWGQVRVVGPGRLEREELWRTPVSPAETLWYWGLVFRVGTLSATGDPVEMAYVPDVLMLYLPTPPPQEIPSPEPIAAPPRTLAGDDTLGEALVTLWTFLQNESVRPAPDGSWPARLRENFLALFPAEALPRLQLLETLALEQGWIHVDERHLLRPVPGPMLEWLRGGRRMQWCSLAQAWEQSRLWNDLAQISSLHPDPVRGWLNDPRASRARALGLLRRYTPGAWYTLTGLLDYAHEHEPDFLRPDGDYESWNLRDAATEAPLRGFATWPLVEGALLAFLVTGPLAWLGLVDLGWTAPHLPPDCFSINAAGAAFLKLDGDFTLPEPPPVELRRDGVLITPAGRRYERFQISRIAELVGMPGRAFGKETAYRLTPLSLARAKAQRISLERILEFLQTATERPLPAAFQKAIERSYNAGEQVRLARVWLLRVKDPELLDYPAIHALLQERLGPRMALVRDSDRERLLELLIQEGLLSEIVEE